MELSGRVALVTGGGSGIGRATARRLADEGMQVCVADINGAAALSVAASIGGLGLAADMSDSDKVDEVFDRCIDAFGSVDLAYLNAGFSSVGGDLAILDNENYRRALGINVDGVVFGARAALRSMRAGRDRGDRAIIATASAAGLDPFYPSPVYTLTKHAVVGFMRALGPDLAAEGIGVQTICPGLTDTGMLPKEVKETLKRSGIPVISAEEIADAVVQAARSPLSMSGTCWLCLPGKPPAPFEFNHASGPHDAINVHR